METPAGQNEHFDSISEIYYQSRQLSNHLFYKALLWDLFFKNKDYLRKANMLVLEPMCGYGEGKQIVEKHLETDIEYEGFDYSENLVSKVTKENPGLNVTRVNIYEYQPRKQYDIVIIIGGLHHVPDYASQAVGKVYKALVPNGYFINFEATQNNAVLKAIRDRIYKNNKLFESESERAFDLPDLNSVFKENKFEIVDQIYPGLLAYVLYYNPDAFPLLNIGGKTLVKLLFALDSLFFRNIIGSKLSFATMTLLKKT